MIIIPSSVEEIGDEAFDGCDYLEKVLIESEKISNALVEASSVGNLLESSQLVYIKTGLPVEASLYLTDNFEKQEVSDMEGYDMYKRK